MVSRGRIRVGFLSPLGGEWLGVRGGTRGSDNAHGKSSCSLPPCGGGVEWANRRLVDSGRVVADAAPHPHPLFPEGRGGRTSDRRGEETHRGDAAQPLNPRAANHPMQAGFRPGRRRCGRWRPNGANARQRFRPVPGIATFGPRLRNYSPSVLLRRHRTGGKVGLVSPRRPSTKAASESIPAHDVCG